MASLTFILNSKTTLNLMRRNSLSGGPEASGSVYRLTALSSNSQHKKHHHKQVQHDIARLSVIQLDRAPPGFPNPRVAATTVIPAQSGEVVKSGCSVFVKWADQPDRIRKLAHEAEVYSTELRHLQGSVVPRMYGYYVDRSVRPTFACLILEYLNGSLPKEFQRYNQECMYLSNKLSEAGIIHNQLYGDDRRRHIISSKSGLRVVDFSEARRGNEQQHFERPSVPFAPISYQSEPLQREHVSRNSGHRMVDIDGGPMRVPTHSRSSSSGSQQYLTVPAHHMPDVPRPHM
ncbi:hypothetical protein SCHPADRAFT_934811 [Schizopora paradoxa]|uniref:Protein kinase domain-containing protein n=1 Tax=Schizopora paradoxa TaxID=27342 RepID=A0A0H2S7J3_9AGAM|nr:hypothetical protein SCHPADRAFT_934811 [Schizopora paradoxa]